MALKIGDYALIGDCETAALVGKDGSINWLCWPNFSSDACMAALLGDADNGRWTLAPRDPATVNRLYCGDTAILKTRFRTGTGEAAVIDFMPWRDAETSEIVRIIIGEHGRVGFQMALDLRFDYGRLKPWTSRLEDGSIEFIAGPHAAILESDIDLQFEHACHADFEVAAGERKAFVLQYRRSYADRHRQVDPQQALALTESAWQDWSARCTYRGPYRDAVMRSLITIKLLTSRQTGGIVAAPTLGLPEKIGGKRNFDYRFCCLRDATFTLLALMHSGYTREASEWRDWLLRAVAGMPQEVRPFYGLGGEHRLPEWEIGWLAGYRHSAPVLAGNAAYSQLQIDVYGEVLDVLHQAREQNIPQKDWSWQLQYELVSHVEGVWQEPDAGIWEARHGREHFTYSRVMAWVALDRAVRAAEQNSLDWPLERWRDVRARIHRDVCERGYDEDGGGFVRSYETREPDGANLLIPLVGFLSPHDPRIRATVERTERDLMRDGFVMRYDTEKSEDGFPSGEGVFLACSFWYVDNLILLGRADDASTVFERLLGVRNDVGLLSEEYDPSAKQLLGNFPQGLSHLALVNSACNLAQHASPAHARASGQPSP